MALTFHLEPSGIYPAYNDCYVEFSSGLANNNVGEMTVNTLSGAPTFKVNKNASNRYVFNLKEIVKSLINADGFRDPDDSFPAGWSASYPYGLQALDIDFNAKYYINGVESTADTPVNKDYNFSKSAKQVGESVYVNEAQILNYTETGTTWYLSYWEGFPFAFELQDLDNTDTIDIKNLNTGLSLAQQVASANGTHRIHIDKVSENWTGAAVLPIPDLRSVLEIKQNAVLKSNLYLKKIIENRGIYLKWFNNDGGYSYHLFEVYYKEELKARSLGTVGANEFLNVGSFTAPDLSLGKRATQQYTLRTTADDNEIKILRSLFTSPSVQMWSSQIPMEIGEWIDVSLNSGMRYNNKPSKQDIVVKIELPEFITPRL